MTQMSMGANIAVSPNSVRVLLRWTGSPAAPDVDAAALLIGRSGEVGSDADFVFYNQPAHYGGAVRMGTKTLPPHPSDAIDLDLDAVAGDVEKIVLAASADSGTLGDVPDLVLELIDRATNQSLATFAMQPGAETAYLTGELYRRGGGWKFRAIGQGYASGLAGLADDFGIDVGQSPVPDVGPVPASPPPSPDTPPPAPPRPAAPAPEPEASTPAAPAPQQPASENPAAAPAPPPPPIGNPYPPAPLDFAPPAPAGYRPTGFQPGPATPPAGWPPPPPAPPQSSPPQSPPPQSPPPQGPPTPPRGYQETIPAWPLIVQGAPAAGLPWSPHQALPPDYPRQPPPGYPRQPAPGYQPPPPGYPAPPPPATPGWPPTPPAGPGAGTDDFWHAPTMLAASPAPFAPGARPDPAPFTPSAARSVVVASAPPEISSAAPVAAPGADDWSAPSLSQRGPTAPSVVAEPAADTVEAQAPPATATAPISLRRNETTDLVGPGGQVLTRVVFSLGWVPAEGRGDTDLDASVIAFDADADKLAIVWYLHVNEFVGALQHTGDSRRSGYGNVEQILVDLERLPDSVASLVFTINSFRGQTFTDVAQAYCAVQNVADGAVLARVDLAQTQPSTALLVCELRRHGPGRWQLRAIGEFHDFRTVRKLVPAAARQVEIGAGRAD